MKIIPHEVNGFKIAEVKSADTFIKNAADGLDLLGNLYYQGYDKIIIYKVNITNNFFDLKTGIAGEILQKFSNYRVRLAVVGEFSHHSGKSLKEFILESNKTGHINFVATLPEALKKLSEV